MSKPDKIINRVLYGVDVVIFDSQGRVLMLERDVKDEKFKTGWEYVKGGAKVDEDYLVAAKREIKEEAGVEAEYIGGMKDLIEVDTRYRKKPDYDYVYKKALVFVYLSREVSLDNNEHTNFKWMDFDEAFEKVWVEFGKEILEGAKGIFDEWKRSGV